MAFKYWFAVFSLLGLLVQTYGVQADGPDAEDTSEMAVRLGKRPVDLSTISRSPTAVDDLTIETFEEKVAEPKVTREPATVPSRSVAGESCKKVCADIKTFLRRDAQNVKIEYERWMDRLGLKADIVIYHRDESAAHGLLRFMSNDYVTRAPENQMTMEFLESLMNKCFPEAVVDIDRARMSELVNILWASKNLVLEKKIDSCH